MKATTIKRRAKELTGIHEDEYAQAVFELGIAYLEHHFNGDDWSVSTVSQTPQFWAWWRNQWMNMDEIFVATYYDPVMPYCPEKRTQQHLKKAWYRRHQPEKVVALITADVLDAAGEIFDRITKQKEVQS